MKVWRSLTDLPKDFGPSAVAIGNFDGVHIGHRAIFSALTQAARERGLTSVALTFDPHPARILAPDRAPRLISTIGQRLRRIGAEGIDVAVLLPFSKELALWTPGDFVRRSLVEALHARLVMVGEDFRFGHKQAGDIGTLRELGGELGFEVLPAATVNFRGSRASSSAVRMFVESSRVSRACRLLGGPFALEGDVVQGKGIGSRQTVPTLNIHPENELLPALGVYVTRARDLASGLKWNAVTNVGFRPTFDGHDLTVETFLLDQFDGRPRRHLEIEFLRYVRPERKFDSPEALRAQILKDVTVAQRLHRRLRVLGLDAGSQRM